MNIKSIIARVGQVAHGFKPIRAEAEKIARTHSCADAFIIAREFYASEIPQARMVGTFIFGFIATDHKPALNFLKTRVSRDADWRVQEILAQAFDQFARDIGYENALPTIRQWLANKNPNVRRAVTEGLRIWTTRDYFRTHPERAIRLLSALKDDESAYVRRSVGNALRDISRKHRDLIRAELQTWDVSDARVKETHKLASGFIKK